MIDTMYFIPFKNKLSENELDSILNDARIKELLKQNMFFIDFSKDIKSLEYAMTADIANAACKILEISIDGCYVTICDTNCGKILKTCLEDEFHDVYLRRITVGTKMTLDENEVVNLKLIKFCIDACERERA